MTDEMMHLHGLMEKCGVVDLSTEEPDGKGQQANWICAGGRLGYDSSAQRPGGSARRYAGSRRQWAPKTNRMALANCATAEAGDQLATLQRLLR